MQPCEYLEWDSSFFGIRIAKYRGHVLSESGLREAEEWCRDERIECLFLLADFSDAQTVFLAETNNFRLMDARVLLEAEIQVSPEPAVSVRQAQPEDGDALKQIARVSHYDSRFFFDARFSRSRCEDLYATWIERSVEGWASTVLVAEADGHVAGYVTCHLSDSSEGSIGLLAVDSQYRGRGLGQQMLAAAMRVFEQGKMRRATVVTQARNIASQRLYQRAGFRTRRVQLWFHRWF